MKRPETPDCETIGQLPLCPTDEPDPAISGPAVPTPDDGPAVPTPDDGVVAGTFDSLHVVMIAGLVVLAVATLVLLILWLRARARAAETRARAARPVSTAPAPPAAGRAVPDRVISDLISLGDATAEPPVRAQVERVLDGLGVEPVAASEGAPFDPDRHSAATTRVTDDPSRHHRIAEVVRTGWVRASGETIRAADVVVWVPR